MTRKAASNVSRQGGVTKLLECRYRRLSVRYGGREFTVPERLSKKLTGFLAVITLNFSL